MNRFAWIALFLLGCPPAPQPPPGPDADSAPPSPPAVVEAAPEEARKPPKDASADVAPSSSPVGRACAAMAFVGCPEAVSTPGGQSCEQVYTPVRSFPGLVFDATGIAACRDIACMRKHGLKCGAK